MPKNINSLKLYYNYLFFDEIEKLGLDKKQYAIAGGAIRDYLIGDPVKDIDIFIASKDAEEALVTKLHDFSKSKVIKILNEYVQLLNIIYNKRWFQIIKGKYFNLEELHNEFDFTICCATLTSDNFYCHPRFFEDCLTKRLVTNKLDYPLSSLERLQKYIKKGYTICNGGLLDIAKAIKNEKIDLNDPKQNKLKFYPDKTLRFIGFD